MMTTELLDRPMHHCLNIETGNEIRADHAEPGSTFAAKQQPCNSEYKTPPGVQTGDVA
ncbi:MAG: hypothetical protein WCH04_03665 [Gammaproteobacteria bacterium]